MAPSECDRPAAVLGELGVVIRLRLAEVDSQRGLFHPFHINNFVDMLVIFG
jgi:hypothetical protein